MVNGAHRYLTAGLAAGTITRRPCARCKAVKVEGHHADYRRPWIIQWLCHRHHRAAHAGYPKGWMFLGKDSRARPRYQAQVKSIKLTVGEKKAKGTHQKSRDAIRPLAEVQTDIEEALESLGDMRFNLREAGKAIRAEGVLILVVTRSNDNKEVTTKKLNPACKLQREMLTSIKSAKRALVLLREEEQLAQKNETPEQDEFEGL